MCVSGSKNSGLPNRGDNFPGRHRFLLLAQRGVQRWGCDCVAYIPGDIISMSDWRPNHLMEPTARW